MTAALHIMLHKCDANNKNNYNNNNKNNDKGIITYNRSKWESNPGGHITI